MLEVGIKGRAEAVVDESRLAINVGSGNVALLSSPIMVALMEQASWTSVSSHLDEGLTTVGISLEIKHNRPTPLGMRIWAESELVGILKGKRLVFAVEAFDEEGSIGEGTHVRALVEQKPFEDKVYGR